MIDHVQSRAPVVALKANISFEKLPPSPPELPSITSPLKYIGVSDRRMPRCQGPTVFHQTTLPVPWSSATTLPSRWPRNTLPSPIDTPGWRPPEPMLKPASKVGVYCQSSWPVVASIASTTLFDVARYMIPL